MTNATQGAMAFTPRARLLKLIGSELISDEIVAITELVKNAHDADASTVTIEFTGVTSLEGKIVVRDDGHGMDLSSLLENWMSPAGSSKAGRARRVTRRGRRVLGEKGVGRFAVDKLGSRLDLVSRCDGDGMEVCASFDWDAFDSETRMLADVQTPWYLRPAGSGGPGTVLEITGLRSVWTERMFKRLSTRLARLRSPFRDSNGFKIVIESDEFPHYSGELDSPFLDRAPYRMDVDFDGHRTISIRIDDSEPVIYGWNRDVGMACGPVRIRLFAFDLEGESLAKVGPRMETRAWLKEWSGISIYRDGFRVWPYGEPHDDWLRLDQRRVNNPVVCLSNNQVVGFVEISGDRNPELRDQTNREGLLNNTAFQDLKALMLYVLQHLEAARQARRRPVDRNQGASDDKAAGPSFEEILDRAAEKVEPDIAAEIRRAAAQAREAIQKEAQRSRKIEESFVQLAGVGLAVGDHGSLLKRGVASLAAEVESLKGQRSNLLGVTPKVEGLA